MAINTFYNKYRPKKFADIIGQNDIIYTLKTSIINNHCFIFSGTRGIGKTTIARILALYVNCLNKNNDVCLVCDNCKKILNDLTTDIIELDAASNNSVDDIRAIISTVEYLPQNLAYKIYIIDEAHMLSNAAWNALLKTLEQCPDHIYFIFATTEFHKIPLTIISRCISFNFMELNLDELNQVIKNVCKNEKINIDNESIYQIAKLANGSARDCLTYLQQAANYCENDIKIKKLNLLFNLIDYNKIIDLILLINDNKEIEAFNCIDEIKGLTNSKNFINILSDVLINIYSFLITNDNKYINNFNKCIQIEKIDLNLIKFLSSLLSNLMLIKYENNIYDYLKLSLTSYFNNNKNNDIKNIKDTKNVNVTTDKQYTLNDILLSLYKFNDVNFINDLNNNKKNIMKLIDNLKLNKLFNMANKFLLGYDNFAILIFDDNMQSYLFNENYNHTLLNNDLYIYALSIEQIKDFKRQYTATNINNIKKIEANKIIESFKNGTKY